MHTDLLLWCYRLNAFTIIIPPLRERCEESPLFMEQLIRRGAVEPGQQAFPLSERLKEAPRHELRLLHRFPNPVTTTLHDQQPAGPEGMRSVVNGVKNQTEIRRIQEALSVCGWNRRRAANNLNISYRALLYKIQQHGLTALLIGCASLAGPLLS